MRLFRRREATVDPLLASAREVVGLNPMEGFYDDHDPTRPVKIAVALSNLATRLPWGHPAVRVNLQTGRPHYYLEDIVDAAAGIVAAHQLVEPRAPDSQGMIPVPAGQRP